VRTMLVRPAERADAGDIAAIYAHYVATSAATFDESAPDTDDVAAKISNATLPFLVAVEKGSVVGYAYLWPYSARSGYRHTAESSVYVAPDARAQGVGRALLERLLADGEEAGVREVIAVIAVSDDPASVELHRALGFREAGRLESVGFKHDRWRDTLLMQRSLAR